MGTTEDLIIRKCQSAARKSMLIYLVFFMFSESASGKRVGFVLVRTAIPSRNGSHQAILDVLPDYKFSVCPDFEKSDVNETITYNEMASVLMCPEETEEKLDINELCFFRFPFLRTTKDELQFYFLMSWLLLSAILIYSTLKYLHTKFPGLFKKCRRAMCCCYGLIRCCLSRGRRRGGQEEEVEMRNMQQPQQVQQQQPQQVQQQQPQQVQQQQPQQVQVQQQQPQQVQVQVQQQQPQQHQVQVQQQQPQQHQVQVQQHPQDQQQRHQQDSPPLPPPPIPSQLQQTQVVDQQPAFHVPPPPQYQYPPQPQQQFYEEFSSTLPRRTQVHASHNPFVTAPQQQQQNTLVGPAGEDPAYDAYDANSQLGASTNV